MYKILNQLSKPQTHYKLLRYVCEKELPTDDINFEVAIGLN